MSDAERDDPRVDRFNSLGAAAFGQLGEITPADDALLERMVENTVSAAPATAPATATAAATTKIGAKLTIALIVGGAAVAGALWWPRGPALEPAPTPVPIIVPITAPTVEREPVPEPVPARPATTAGQPDPVAPVETARASEPQTTKTARRPSTQAPGRHEDPAALLLAANRARRAHEADGARALYRELAERFPGTREHRSSQVALGDLELEHYHRPAQALEQYDAYLSAKPNGNLAEAALYGKARALDQLQRKAEATAAWSTLLERFPDSLHAPAAKRRARP